MKLRFDFPVMNAIDRCEGRRMSVSPVGCTSDFSFAHATAVRSRWGDLTRNGLQQGGLRFQADSDARQSPAMSEAGIQAIQFAGSGFEPGWARRARRTM